jgi:hypothetical protein
MGKKINFLMLSLLKDLKIWFILELTALKILETAEKSD